MIEVMKSGDWKWLGVGIAVVELLLGLAVWRGVFRYVLFDPAWDYKRRGGAAEG